LKNYFAPQIDSERQISQSTRGKASVEKQSNAVDDLIAQKVDRIAILPIDGMVAKSWVDRAASPDTPFVDDRGW
jgi:ABC-type sugar transport system substrate-binding protein